jgi:hypothetical protein
VSRSKKERTLGIKWCVAPVRNRRSIKRGCEESKKARNGGILEGIEKYTPEISRARGATKQHSLFFY